MKIPVSSPFLGEEETKLVSEAVAAGEISGNFGKFLPQFEKDFANYVGCENGVAVSNGTTALHLALAALDIGPGDEVLAGTFTNMATFFAILYQGATPVPIDIEPDTWNINPALIEEKITPRTKAILPIHIYGHPADMDPIMTIAKKHSLFVIEDAAEAHGATYKGRPVGSFGDLNCFSFYANKIITTGEGGMITTNNKELAAKARMLGSLAYGREVRFRHEAVGFNYRLTNFQAALGCAQLKKIETTINLKRDLAAFYDRELAGISELQLPVQKDYAKNVYWMYHVVLRGKAEGRRQEVVAALKEAGIDTREAFLPYNLQKPEITKGLVTTDACPIANNVAVNGFYLPSGPVLSEEERNYVAISLKEILAAL